MNISLSMALFAAGPLVPMAELLLATICGVLIAAASARSHDRPAATSRRCRASGVVAGVARAGDAVPHRLSDAQLCRAWRTTTLALRVRTAPDELLAISAWREEYLDEMEQRHAAGFRAWLEDGQCDDETLESFLVGDGRAGA